jgi:aminoglycoside phosphotransferase family enzyme
VSLDTSTIDQEPTLADKVAFLGRAANYRLSDTELALRETHMSWVFLAGDKVYKLKKPVRFPYLDFSTLARREAACRAELHLNRRLARDVYLDVQPLVRTERGFAIGGSGEVVDWLVVMRRLDERSTLQNALIEGRVGRSELDRLISTLVSYYRTARRIYSSPGTQIGAWQRSLNSNARILLDPKLGLPTGRIRRIDHIQRSFLMSCRDLLAKRARDRRIVDGHGDLRPEHVWLTDGIVIIDCLEFNAQLRFVDPFDEIAYLSLECERLGARWVGDYCRRKIAWGLHDDPPEALYRFYRCHRAMLRARLAIAHLLEPNPRTPEKWPRLARAYLDIAERDAAQLEDYIKTRRGGPETGRLPSTQLLRQAAELRAEHGLSAARSLGRGGTPARHP